MCVVVAIDRRGDIVSQYAGRGRITATEIDAMLGSRLLPGVDSIIHLIGAYVSEALVLAYLVIIRILATIFTKRA